MQSRRSHKRYPIIGRGNRRIHEDGIRYAFRVLLDDPEWREAFSDFMVAAEKTGIDGEGKETWRRRRWNS